MGPFGGLRRPSVGAQVGIIRCWPWAPPFREARAPPISIFFCITAHAVFVAIFLEERQERLHTLLNVPSLSVEPLPRAPCLLWKYIGPTHHKAVGHGPVGPVGPPAHLNHMRDMLEVSTAVTSATADTANGGSHSSSFDGPPTRALAPSPVATHARVLASHRYATPSLSGGRACSQPRGGP